MKMRLADVYFTANNISSRFRSDVVESTISDYIAVSRFLFSINKLDIIEII